MSKNIRIATVTATGKRYFVQSLDFRADKAFLWGEVTAHNGAATTHEHGFRLPLNEVSIREVERTTELARELFWQGVESAKERGLKVVGTSGKKSVRVTVSR